MKNNRYSYNLVTIILFIVLFHRIYDFNSVYNIVCNDFIFSGDVRQQVTPFLFKKTIVDNDYILGYHLDAMLPIGIKFLYGTLMKPGLVKFFSKIVPYLLFIVLVFCVFYSVKIIKGKKFAICSVIIIIFCNHFIGTMYGGLSRAFAFPFLALGLYYLLKSDYFYLGIVTIASCLFYPVSSLISGTSLLISMIYDSLAKKNNLQNTKNIFILGFVLLACIIILLPSLRKGANYGARISEKETLVYREAAIGGRYGSDSTPPYNNIISEVDLRTTQFIKNIHSLIPSLSLRHLAPYRSIWFLKYLLILGILVLLVKKILIKDQYYIKILIFIVSFFFLYIIAIIFEPYFYFPSRYIIYGLPLIFAICIPEMLYESFKILVRIAKIRLSVKVYPVLVLLTLVLISSLIGKKPNNYAGYVNEGASSDIYDAINEIDENSLIAGWPNDIVDNVAYLCNRRVYLSHEVHQVFHEKYIIEMRRRFNLFLSAYFSRESHELKTLMENERITHIVVNKNHFINNYPPKYFLPFDETIEKIFNDNKGNFFISNYINNKSKNFIGQYFLIDIASIDK